MLKLLGPEGLIFSDKILELHIRMIILINRSVTPLLERDGWTEVVKMKKLLILLVLLTFAAPAYGATIYKWVDEKGVINFTDDYNNVPLALRNRVRIEEYVQQEGNAAPAQRTAATAKEEVRTDIYGRDKTWWRGKVRPWKGLLREVSENYKKARKEYMEQAEGLSPYKFGRMSLTQYQMLSSRLEVLSKEMETYQGQIAEAKGMLAKLSKEAKETGADPAWIE